MKRIHANISQEMLSDENEYRKRIDLLRSRANLLSGRDKLLMTMYLEKGNSFRQMARLAGVNETIIARRIRKVTNRLMESEYIVCLRNRDKFTKTEMAIAKDHFLIGLSMKKIAIRRHLTFYRVRETLRKIRQTITTIQRQNSV